MLPNTAINVNPITHLLGTTFCELGKSKDENSSDESSNGDSGNSNPFRFNFGKVRDVTSLIPVVSSPGTGLSFGTGQAGVRILWQRPRRRENGTPKDSHGRDEVAAPAEKMLTSGEILKKQIGRWPESILRKLDLDFLDAPFPALGKSDVEAFFDPPYYEWYQRNESIAYIEDYMVTHGPFDGLLGFSQGAFIAAASPGMQAEGVAFTKVPKIKFVILIAGAKFLGFKFGQPKLAVNAFSSPVQCPSLHIIGENDFLKEQGMVLLESFVDPVVIYHSKGHTIPRIGVFRIQSDPLNPSDLLNLICGLVD
ncbi:alpha/beta-Hydrolases superfamily protein [Citrus sinensis]|uniref:Alpha/beta-Hydrolases superfamily protein n=1 Tax=Citrus sinensis TaxID=2711 RepID=A0ACB8J5J9_CITSI|nr:alpha/beta-Hydrolases superfamily protein [Citrus sinensis]